MRFLLQSFLFYALCLLACLAANAQRFYAPLPLGQSVYDTALHVPLAVQYRLPRWAIGDAVRIPSWQFLSDIPDSVTYVRSSFYTNSGYDRGHLLPAADRSFDLGVMRSTFVMSNVAPQTPRLNRGKWSMAEKDVRNLAMINGEVDVYCCPVFFLQDTAWIVPGNIAIPHAFLKVVMNSARDSIFRYWLFLNK